MGSTTWSHCIGRLHSSGWKTSWSIPDLLSSTRCTEDAVPKSLALRCADVSMPRCTARNLNGELACPVRHSRSRQPLHSDLRRGHILQKSLLPLPVREGKISSAANVTSRTTRRSRLLATPPDFPPAHRLVKVPRGAASRFLPRGHKSSHMSIILFNAGEGGLTYLRPVFFLREYDD